MTIQFPINQGYPGDILRQSEALEATAAGLFTASHPNERVVNLATRHFKRLILTGMGSSFHALHPLYLQLIQHGISNWMVETSELIHYQRALLTPETLLVVVSQSGRSAETVRLMELLQPQAVPILGVTNTPNSPLATLSTACLLTHAGEETSVSCKTYVATLMALSWLGDVVCGLDLKKTRAELEQASPAVSAYLTNWLAHTNWLEVELKATKNLFLAGRGTSLAAVGTGALITKESTHLHAEGMSSAAFRHGPLEMVAEDVYTVVFTGSKPGAELNRKLAADIIHQGGQAGLVDTHPALQAFHLPPAPERLLPILEILPVEMITLALASLRHRVPGEFEHGAKVTTSE